MGLCWSLVVELRVLFSSRNCYRHLCLFKQDFVEAEKTPGKIMNEMTSFFFPSVFFSGMGRASPRVLHSRRLEMVTFPFCLSKGVHLLCCPLLHPCLKTFGLWIFVCSFVLWFWFFPTSLKKNKKETSGASRGQFYLLGMKVN